MDLAPEGLVAVYAAPDNIAAEMVRGVLEAEGIRAVIDKQVTDGYAQPLRLAAGFWGEVCVAAQDAEVARAVLDAYEAGRGRLGDNELETEAVRAFDPNV